MFQVANIKFKFLIIVEGSCSHQIEKMLNLIIFLWRWSCGISPGKSQSRPLLFVHFSLLDGVLAQRNIIKLLSGRDRHGVSFLIRSFLALGWGPCSVKYYKVVEQAGSPRFVCSVCTASSLIRSFLALG